MVKKNRIPTIYLFLGGTILFSLSWLMSSFPLLAFISIAPFIAIAVNNRAEKSLWSAMELILLGLSVSFWAGQQFAFDRLALSILFGIIFTLPFLGYSFTRKNLGAKTNVIVILLFWMAIEYLMLKIYPVLFLADLLQLKSAWTGWTGYTGYLGASLWILGTNVLLFQALLTEQKTNWFSLTLFLLMIVIPFVLSFRVVSPVSRETMMAVYDSSIISPPGYGNAEWVARTSAWISVLIVLFTFVKQKTKRK